MGTCGPFLPMMENCKSPTEALVLPTEYQKQLQNGEKYWHELETWQLRFEAWFWCQTIEQAISYRC